MTAESPDPLEPLAQLFQDLRSTPGGLSGREAARRLEVTGPNELARRGGRTWPGEHQCDEAMLEKAQRLTSR